MTSKEALVVLNMLEGIGPVIVRRLLEVFSSPERILSTSRGKLLQVPGVGEEIAGALCAWEESVNLAAELERCEAFGCELVTAADGCFPSQLGQIYDPPIVLYVKGSITKQDHSGVALVGARRSTHYGRDTARRLAQQLAGVGVTVVSGGARGIDSAAHNGALHGGGRTICVLGNGINRIYPPENRALFDRIAENGAVMTQFPFNRPADRQSFPIRNRIVAGMTMGTVVVEANAKSGALITANMANDYGRQVFAVPGPVHSPCSKGCHELIKNGAKLCESMEDILTEFEYLFPATPTTPKTVVPSLSEDERRLIELIQANDVHVDQLVRDSGLSVSSLSVMLLQLEMKGFVVQQPGQIYSICGGR